MDKFNPDDPKWAYLKGQHIVIPLPIHKLTID